MEEMKTEAAILTLVKEYLEVCRLKKIAKAPLSICPEVNLMNLGARRKLLMEKLQHEVDKYEMEHGLL